IPGKTESKRVALTSGQLTTEEIVHRVKELSKLRDEILQVMRQLNLTRGAAPSTVDQLDYDSELELAKRELDEARNEYQEVQGKVEKIQRQIDESMKKIAGLTEISQTGFATDELESVSVDFRRILGQLPVKKLDDLRRRAGQTLNRRLDEVVDALMLLRGILKLGEGTQASRIYARLERVVPVETVNSLSRKGIVELESSS